MRMRGETFPPMLWGDRGGRPFSQLTWSYLQRVQLFWDTLPWHPFSIVSRLAMFTALQEFDFQLLDDSDFKEDSVREAIIHPILRELGYSEGGLNRIVRSRSLRHPFIKIGSTERPVTIIPDYLLLAANKPAWILDAKAPRQPVSSGGHVEQAYSYAKHPEIRSRYFALCNGSEFALFERESEGMALY
ncbi:MAG: type I restriction enzyme HsdR N-terminal domain-containing protein, partial [Chloroflexi bacterium]|nr:type I restriction enzyme HsdR N-terminal domain-containing protein [Chloroflexota bacterium]